MLEHYVPAGLAKPYPAADYATRQFWIKAKHVQKQFMTPFSQADRVEADGAANLRARAGAAEAVLPKRLVDYFLVMSWDKLVLPDKTSERPPVCLAAAARSTCRSPRHPPQPQPRPHPRTTAAPCASRTGSQ